MDISITYIVLFYNKKKVTLADMRTTCYVEALTICCRKDIKSLQEMNTKLW